jgi:hypothetical protein
MKKVVKVIINGETYYKETDEPNIENNEYSETNFNFDDKDTSPKANKLIYLLPFMSEEELHNVALSILEHSPKYKNLKIEYVLPFLDSDDCDKIFLDMVHNSRGNLSSVVPFVSEEVLHKLVTDYVEGNINSENISFDELYPFLESKDVKLLFDYLLEKEE